MNEIMVNPLSYIEWVFQKYKMNISQERNIKKILPACCHGATQEEEKKVGENLVKKHELWPGGAEKLLARLDEVLGSTRTELDPNNISVELDDHRRGHVHHDDQTEFQPEALPRSRCKDKKETDRVQTKRQNNVQHFSISPSPNGRARTKLYKRNNKVTVRQKGQPQLEECIRRYEAIQKGQGGETRYLTWSRFPRSTRQTSLKKRTKNTASLLPPS